MTSPTRTLRTLLACAILALLATAAESRSAGPPFGAGATWSYKVTMTKDGQTRTGTSTETYRGLSRHAGTSYHLVEQRYSLMPGFLQRTFLTWDGSRFRQMVTVESDGKNTAEIVFDKPIPLGAQDASAGTANVVLNGAQQATVPWSFTSQSAGKESVTVPAGSFQAQRWDGVLKLGTLDSRFIVHVVGITDVRVESTQTLNGSPLLVMLKELTRGPIR